MGNSRKPSSSELPERVAAALGPAVTPGAHLVAGVSGGLDSMALLSVLAGLASPASTDRSAIESRPPDTPATRWAPGVTAGPSAAATLSGSSLELGFLEFPITHQALEALLDEFLGTLVGETAQGVGQRALEVLCHRGGVAVSATRRLGDDLVDQPEGLEAARGD